MFNLAANARHYLGALVPHRPAGRRRRLQRHAGWASGVYPEITFPRIAVVARKPGLDLRNMELQVTVPLEQAVNSVIGSTRPLADHPGRLRPVIDFSPGTDMRRAEQLTWNRIGAARSHLPADGVLRRADDALGLPHPVRGPHRRRQARPSCATTPTTNSRRGSRTSPDVLYCNVAGGDLREIVVEARPDDLLAAGLSAADLADRISKLHRLQPVGRIEEPPSPSR